MAAVRVRIRGRVQGVGFRYATRSEAVRLGLAGWVRNCPDGTVEAEFYGPHHEVESMVTWCSRGPMLSRVDDVSTEWVEDETASGDGFRIR